MESAHERAGTDKRRREVGECAQRLGPSRQIAMNLVDGGMGSYTFRKVDTYNGWYWLCDVFDLFLVEFLL